jgi:hypothetical protein
VIPINLEVGDLIDLLYQKREERLKMQGEVDNLEMEEKAIREAIISNLGEQGLQGGKGMVATASITRRVVGAPKDWDALYGYIQSTGSFDLLHKRISDTAYRDRLEQGVVVPGLEPVELVGLSLVKAGKAK